MTGASQRDIQHHYDVSDDFYGLWLDARQVYSAARPDHVDASLEDAQIAKLDHHLDSLRLPAEARLLDVGCGWGSLLDRATERGLAASVTGLTLSRNQAETCLRRLPGADIRLQTWDDFEATPFDGITCVGALEHFVSTRDDRAQKIARYRAFFEFCRRCLEPGGRLALQTIGYGDLPAGLDRFIADKIFPGSDLPYLSELAEAAHNVLRIESVENRPDDYAWTCRAWAARLEAQREQANALVGEALTNDWHRFLRMSAAGFEQGALMLYRLVLRRID